MLDGQMACNAEESYSPFCTSTAKDEESYSDCLLKFISAQAILILEGAIVTHNSALSAFHQLKGVDILVRRLNSSHLLLRVVDGEDAADVNAMIMGGTLETKKPHRNLQAARRVLLFSAVNCLTVVFHQHESGGPTPSLRRERHNSVNPSCRTYCWRLWTMSTRTEAYWPRSSPRFCRMS